MECITGMCNTQAHEIVDNCSLRPNLLKRKFDDAFHYDIILAQNAEGKIEEYFLSELPDDVIPIWNTEEEFEKIAIQAIKTHDSSSCKVYLSFDEFMKSITK